MNDRLTISGNVPAHIAEVLSDPPRTLTQAQLDDAADALEAENRRMAAINAEAWLGDEEFWREELLDTDLAIAADMAYALKHLDAACAELADLQFGQCIAIRRVLSALVGVANSAKPRAESQLFDIYERGEE